MAHHDFDRFGKATWSSPKESNVMIVAGTIAKKIAEPIKQFYEQMPNPKWVIALGSCAISGGPYYRSYSVVMGVDHVVPVDVYVAGCPPTPEALITAFTMLQDKIGAGIPPGVSPAVAHAQDPSIVKLDMASISPYPT